MTEPTPNLMPNEIFAEAIDVAMEIRRVVSGARFEPVQIAMGMLREIYNSLTLESVARNNQTLTIAGLESSWVTNMNVGSDIVRDHPEVAKLMRGRTMVAAVQAETRELLPVEEQFRVGKVAQHERERRANPPPIEFDAAQPEPAPRSDAEGSDAEGSDAVKREEDQKAAINLVTDILFDHGIGHSSGVLTLAALHLTAIVFSLRFMGSMNPKHYWDSMWPIFAAITRADESTAQFNPFYADEAGVLQVRPEAVEPAPPAPPPE